ncbi:ABC transporter permease [Mesorhizobium sp. YC-39]|uniref:ABC transporter permease n=1 Tax=unclassified Mesorhizobium TaxID=325217 RepID=UPI0021E8E552|nr:MULTISPECIES: ABC transporter permease [unclassified Mesorhizobium]MCV3210831.1 ABC transporter permease [Mesorhizobium sp. YC-2]MCV3231065.1 ABC transporter permease [Mesorhizobium sp. YC-39]
MTNTATRSAPSQTALARGLRAVRQAPPTAIFGMVVLFAYVFTAIFAPFIAPYGEFQVVSSVPYAPWDEVNLLGTDQLGRDFLSRMIFGARNSIGIAFVTTLLAFAIGGFFGIMAAALRGVADQVLSRFVDSVMSIPDLIFTLMLLAIFGTSVLNLILIIAILDSTRIFRISRAAAMNVVTLDFVEAAAARGEGLVWRIVHEILPNILPILISEFGMRFCFVFLSIAALSFLGIGLQPPMAEWGSMVRDNATLINMGDITPLIPAGAIALLTIGVNFVADWLLNMSSGLSDEA